MIQLRGVTKGFMSGGERVEILRSLDLAIASGEKVAIIGPSGSGKTTLLSLIAGMDRPDEGQVVVDGIDLATLDQKELARFRNRTIGVVFQSFELVAPFTVLENIMTPMDIAGEPNPRAALDWVQAVELGHRQDALPPTLSGGEKQRTAIARALSMHPKVVLADEPTGSLDRVTGVKIIDLLITEAEKTGTTLIIITHDQSVSARMDRVFELRDKQLHEIV